jgi:hypothetical protein
MSRLVRDYVEIGEFTSLDDLIGRLTALRDGLTPEAEAEMIVRGDGAFGKHLAIAFKRPLTPEEAACEGRYLHAIDRTPLRVAA